MHAARALMVRLGVAAALLMSMTLATVSPLPHSAARAARPSAGTKDLVAYVLQVPFSLPAGYTPSMDGMAVDTAGNLYVTTAGAPPSGVDPYGGSYNTSVMAFDPQGHELHRWVLGDAVGLVPLAIGRDGLLYVAGGSQLGLAEKRLRIDQQVGVFTPDGHFLKVLGPAPPNTPIGNPVDIKLDSKGNIYVANRDSIVRLDPAGHVTAVWKPFGNCAAPAGYLGGLAIAPDDTVWLTANCGKNSGVFHLDASGKLLHDAPDIHVIYPQGNTFAGMAVAGGRVYVTVVTNVGTEGVFVYTQQGKVLGLVGGAHDGYAPRRRVVVSGTNVYFAPYTPLSASGAFHRRAAPRQTSPPADGRLIGKADGGGRVYAPPAGRIDNIAYPTGHGCPDWSDARDDWGQPTIVFKHPPGPNCGVFITELWHPPCPASYSPVNEVDGRPVPVDRWLPVHIVVGGQVLTPGQGTFNDGVEVVPVQGPPDGVVGIHILSGAIRQGPILAVYACQRQGGSRDLTFVYELKGHFDLHDPSGTVVDRATGKPLAEATVWLQFSPTKGGRFGSPPIGGFSPQANPEITPADGSFAWNVADGYWRLSASLFGYRSLTSKVYTVPPPVTRIVLALRRDPRQQALLIDPAGRVGSIRLGTHLPKGKLLGGLRVAVGGGRVRSITVLSSRYRTAKGIGLSSGAVALIAAYPSVVKPIKGTTVPKPRTVIRVRVSHTTFTLKKQRVIGITLR